MKIDASFQNIRLSKIVEVSEMARAIAPAFEARTGLPFIYFQRGEVGVPPPPFLVDCLAQGIAKGYTKYPKSGGEAIYKKSVCEFIVREGGPALDNDCILATMGGQEGLQLLFSCFRGGRCAGFTPCWSCMFDNIFPYTRTTFVPVPLKAEEGWAIDFELLERVLPEVETFYFNTPHNPTGRVFSREEIQRIVDLCAKHNVLLISDEAYRDLVYQGEHVSPLTLDNGTGAGVVSVNTFSKSMAATGFRVGFAATRRKDLIDILTRGEYTQTAGVPTPMQYAFAEGLRHSQFGPWMAAYRADMLERRTALATHLDPRLGATAPQGAFYCFIDLKACRREWVDGVRAEREAMAILINAGIAVVPGSAFGEMFTGHARLSFSTLTAKSVVDGAVRLNEALLGTSAINEPTSNRTGFVAAR
jgi:aspartate/methionine/tyrosine aminotransferase